MLRAGGSYEARLMDLDRNEYELFLQVILDRNDNWEKRGYDSPVLRIYTVKDEGEVTAAVKLTREQGIELGKKLKIIVEKERGYDSESAEEKLFEILRLKGIMSKTQ